MSDEIRADYQGQEVEMLSDPAKAAIKELGHYMDRILDVVRRVRDLIDLRYRLSELPKSSFTSNPEYNTETVFDDVVRLAVVFLHALLEDFLKGLAKRYLPITGEIKDVRLAGDTTKFPLIELVPYKGKTNLSCYLCSGLSRQSRRSVK